VALTTALSGPAGLAEPHPLAVAPFVLLLLAIAVMPLVQPRFWERHYKTVAIGLGLVVGVYYVASLGRGSRMLSSLVDYAGFMALVGSLYVIAGGVHINMSGRATPAVNTGLLSLGALLANVVGTTGASMLLIRPFLRINKHRVEPYHVVFFIFIVSNMGGALTPIGDPPLFLGYLKGVPFFWLLAIPQVVVAWLVCIGGLLAVFYVLDRRNRHGHAPDAKHRARDRIELEGSHNLIFLAAIVALVLAQKAEWLQGIARWPAFVVWGAALGWDAGKAAESATTIMVAGLMVATAAIAHRYANRDALRENEFGFGPVVEVGFLFAGIFATMVPALDLLEFHAGGIGLVTARQYFWSSGVLSSVLDNAPTYLSFLTAALGLHHLSIENPHHMQRFLEGANTWKYVVAVSLGSVFFGASTYVGNGPNFMVKHIAESNGVKCPTFVGYIVRFSVPILLPLFAAVSWLILG